MKAYLKTKYEAAKTTLRTTNWLYTVANAIGLGARNSIVGMFVGMGVLLLWLLIEVAAWDTLQRRDLSNEPVPIDMVYDFLSSLLNTNAVFGAAAVAFYLVMNIRKLRLVSRKSDP